MELGFGNESLNPKAQILAPIPLSSSAPIYRTQ